MPYTFSMITNLVSQIQEQQENLIKEFRQLKTQERYTDDDVTEDHFKVVEVSNLTTTLAGMDVPMLTITDFSH